MMMRSRGQIPIDPSCKNFEELMAASNWLRSVETFGGFLVNTMGFGKTYTVLLFLAYRSLCSFAKLFQNLTVLKPILSVVPSGLVLFQWLEGLRKFPNLVLSVGHGERPSKTKYSKLEALLIRDFNWNSKAVREAAEMVQWPSSPAKLADPTRHPKISAHCAKAGPKVRYVRPHPYAKCVYCRKW